MRISEQAPGVDARGGFALHAIFTFDLGEGAQATIVPNPGRVYDIHVSDRGAAAGRGIVSPLASGDVLASLCPDANGRRPIARRAAEAVVYLAATFHPRSGADTMPATPSRSVQLDLPRYGAHPDAENSLRKLGFDLDAPVDSWAEPVSKLPNVPAVEIVAELGAQFPGGVALCPNLGCIALPR